MAKVVEGFLLGTHYDLTFYLMDGNLYVRMKSSLSRKKVKYSPRFKRTMQSAEELRRASKLASRIYWELSKEQKKMVFVLYKKMTGVAKLAFKYGKSEEEAEREVRDYLVREGVVKVGSEERQVEGVVLKKEVTIEKEEDVIKEQVKVEVKKKGVAKNRNVRSRRVVPSLVMVYNGWKVKGSVRKRMKRLSRYRDRTGCFCDSS